MKKENFRPSEPKRVHFQGMIDIRAMAELCEYFESLGHRPDNWSELLAMTVEGFAKLLRSKGRVNAVKTGKDAFLLLESRGLKFKNKRNEREKLSIISQEEKEIVDDEFLMDRRSVDARKEIEERARKNMESPDFLQDIDSREDMTKEELEAKAHLKDEESAQRMRNMIDHMKKSPTVVSDKDEDSQDEKKQ